MLAVEYVGLNIERESNVFKSEIKYLLLPVANNDNFW